MRHPQLVQDSGRFLRLFVIGRVVKFVVSILDMAVGTAHIQRQGEPARILL
jgi:hypothetical protein